MSPGFVPYSAIIDFFVSVSSDMLSFQKRTGSLIEWLPVSHWGVTNSKATGILRSNPLGTTEHSLEPLSRRKPNFSRYQSLDRSALGQSGFHRADISGHLSKILLQIGELSLRANKCHELKFHPMRVEV